MKNLKVPILPFFFRKINSNFLDGLAKVSLEAELDNSKQRYNHILKQRNALIKDAIKNRDAFDMTIELWSRQLAHEAAIIADMRARFVKRVEKYITECFEQMTGEREVPTAVYGTIIDTAVND